LLIIFADFPFNRITGLRISFGILKRLDMSEHTTTTNETATTRRKTFAKLTALRCGCESLRWWPKQNWIALAAFRLNCVRDQVSRINLLQLSQPEVATTRAWRPVVITEPLGGRQSVTISYGSYLFDSSCRNWLLIKPKSVCSTPGAMFRCHILMTSKTGQEYLRTIRRLFLAGLTARLILGFSNLASPTI
jgi:hypothetical protein